MLEPDQASAKRPGEEEPGQIRLPRSWNGYKQDGSRLPGSGYATFHLRVLTDSPPAVLAVELPAIRTAYKLWVNGMPLGGAGTTGTNPEEAEPGYFPQTVFFNYTGEAALDIVLQVSNFDHRSGGIWKELRLGEAGQLIAAHNRHMGFEMLLLGSLFLMGLYHIGLFLFRFKEQTALYFGLFCLMAGLRALFVGEGAVYRMFPQMQWYLGLRIEYLCYYLGLPAGVLFFRSLYPHETARRVVQLVQWLGCVFGLAVVVLPSRLYTWTLQPFQAITVLVCIYVLYCLVKACLNKRDGVIFAFIGIFVYVCTVAVDIAYYNQWMHRGDISSFGLFFLILMTSFIISMKSFNAYAAVESLSLQLRELDMGLEYRIKERTAELERSNRSLEKMNGDLGRLETSRRHLLSNISHDLGTPMTLIQGYVEALIDRVVTDEEQQQKYLHLILKRINGLNRLIADLFQLSKLEARQIDFSIQEMPIEEFIDYFSERYRLEVRNAGIRFNLNVAAPLPEEQQPMYRLLIDIGRIDQVLTNIIYNAIKHTSQDGLIQLQFIIDSQTLTVKVQDNGDGIDPEDMPYIFDRFYKKSKSRNTSEGGSGLGLAIAKEIIDFHSGRIWAESRVGQGACLSFVLPLRSMQQPSGAGRA